MQVLIEESMDFFCWTFGLMYYLSLCLLLLPLGLWLYKELTMGICRTDTSKMDGKVVLITGGSNGIGFETAVDLAKRGAKLIIGCRKTQGVLHKFQQRVPRAHVEVISLDLSSKSSVQKFAEEVRSKHYAIHVLINNAGMINSIDGPMERRETKDGFELVMATNYLGHSLLNHLLLDLVKNAGKNNEKSRIILVSSIAIMSPEALDLCKLHKKSTYAINFDLEENEKDSRRQYSKTKLAQVMYAKHLGEMLRKKKENTFVSCVHPGFVRTEILDGVPKQAQGLFKALGYILGKNPRQGAQTSIHVATKSFEDPMREANGQFFADCKSNPWYRFLFPKILDDILACKAVYDETFKALGIE